MQPLLGESDLKRIFPKFISEASIDASSMIYMLKTGLLGRAASEIVFFASPGVIKETGWSSLPVKVFLTSEKACSNDGSVIKIAEEKHIPVISEDKKILLKAGEKNILHYNTLMILNYFLLISRISLEEYEEYFVLLSDIARYGKEIFSFAFEVKESIIAQKEKGAFIFPE